MSVSENRPITYPNSNGKSLAENTREFRWITFIKENLEILFSDNPQVFVARNLLWYPVEGHPEICTSPDVMVVFDRPKGDRGSYRQWEEDNIPPQVVFEIPSPENGTQTMMSKLNFYNRYRVKEYYIYSPDENTLAGFQRDTEGMSFIKEIGNWASPRLGIQFDLKSETLEIYRPDGKKFLSSVELYQRAERECQRAERLAAQLRDLGVEPEA